MAAPLDVDYEITITIRDQTGTMIHREVRPVAWQLDAFSTRDDGEWSQAEKREMLFAKMDEAAREVRNWLRGRVL